MSITRRIVIYRASAYAALVIVLTYATLAARIRAGESLSPLWLSLVLGVGLVATSASLPLQARVIGEQLAREEVEGITTDRWGTSARPEIAPGTTIVIRDAHQGPIKLGHHRDAVRWARRVSSGERSERPHVPSLPVRNWIRPFNPWGVVPLASVVGYLLGLGSILVSGWNAGTAVVVGLGLGAAFGATAVAVYFALRRQP